MKFKKGNRWRGNKGQVRYMTWRKNVFELNKGKYGLSKHYVCMKCNKKRKTTKTLHAHHIYSWEKFPNKRYVLCKYCHTGFHYKYKFEALENPNLLIEYIGNNKNSKQIQEYINKND